MDQVTGDLRQQWLASPNGMFRFFAVHWFLPGEGISLVQAIQIWSDLPEEIRQAYQAWANEALGIPPLVRL